MPLSRNGAKSGKKNGGIRITRKNSLETGSAIPRFTHIDLTPATAIPVVVVCGGAPPSGWEGALCELTLVFRVTVSKFVNRGAARWYTADSVNSAGNSL